MKKRSPSGSLPASGTRRSPTPPTAARAGGRVRLTQRGFTLIEVLVAAFLLSIMVTTVITMRSFVARQSMRLDERAFAVEKAMQMLEELRALVAGAERTEIVVLDDYHDAENYPVLLTTDPRATDPAGPLSGNRPFAGSWKYVRNIQVSPLPNDPFARRVEVRVYRNVPGSPGAPAESLAEVVGILKTVTDEYFPTQVYDVYVLALENVPGWWVLLPQIQSVLSEMEKTLEERNPGLEVRLHEVKRLSYGRDLHYAPYVNNASPTSGSNLPFAYLYPGNVDGTNHYYAPWLFEGRVNLDGTVGGGYSLADRYNHAVRYPEEKELYAALGHTTPSWRMLIEEMYSNPDSFRNALIINLHGELVPLPPLRNYSDPAKDPAAAPNVRVVTHPENLRYASGAAVVLRVYPFVTNPDSWPTTAVLSDVVVRIVPEGGANLDVSGVTVERMVGNDAVPYAWQTAVPGTDFFYDESGPDLVLHLKDSPLRHPRKAAAPGLNGGLNPAYRLYGLEYVPAPTHPNNNPVDFSWDLSSPTDQPHNTARWRITVGSGRLADGEHEIQTWIGTPSTTPAYPNLSRTWVWVGEEPPITEQYQFLGDPRHMPYADVKAADGFNWFFRSVASNNWKGYTEAADGWGNDKADADIPRFFLVLREALGRTNAIWSTLNGFSYYYYGLGGEIGYDKTPFPSSIPTGRLPWDAGGNTSQFTINEITGGTRLVARKDGSWYARPWIGELYPDDAYTAWQANGNLPTGASGSDFYRQQPQYLDAGAFGNFGRLSRLREEGCTSFFNGGPFRHAFRDGDQAPIAGPGVDLTGTFHLPLLNPVQASRPFTLNYQANGIGGFEWPVEWNAYSAWRTTLSVPFEADNGARPRRIYYEAQSNHNPAAYDSSSTVRVRRGGQTFYVVVSGLSPQGDTATSQMARLTLATMLGTYLDAGAYSAAQDRIPQLPRVDLTAPDAAFDEVNPASIAVTWTSDWRRWDGSPYTGAYPDPYTEPGMDVVYNLKYSRNFQDWFFVQDDTPAEIGVLDPSAPHALTFPSPPFTYSWNVSALSRGTVYLRVEAYRRVQATGVYLPLHYSYDQVRFYLSK